MKKPREIKHFTIYYKCNRCGEIFSSLDYDRETSPYSVYQLVEHTVENSKPQTVAHLCHSDEYSQIYGVADLYMIEVTNNIELSNIINTRK